MQLVIDTSEPLNQTEKAVLRLLLTYGEIKDKEE